MSTRTRQLKRTKAQAESGSEYEVSVDEESEGSEYNPPPQKRRRRNVSKKKRAEHSDVEDCNDGMANSSTSLVGSGDQVIGLKEENRALKKRVKELEKLVKSLQKSKAPRPTANGKKQFTAFAKALKRTAKLKKNKFYGVSSLVDSRQSVEAIQSNTILFPLLIAR